MSIWSSLWSGIKSVGSTIGNTLGLSGNNTATASNSWMTNPSNMSTASVPVPGSINAVQVPSSVGPVGSASYNAFIASNPKGTLIAPGSTVSNQSSPISMSSGTQNISSSGGYSPSSSYSSLGATYAAPVQTPVNMTVSGSGLAGSQATGQVGGGLGSQAIGSVGGGLTAGDVYNYNVALGLNPDGTSKKEVNPDGTPVDKDKEKEKNQNDYIKEALNMLYERPTVDSESIRRGAEADSGLTAAQQQKNNTQNAINGITAKMNADLLQLRDIGSREGVTEAVYGGQQAQISREATIKLLPLQSQLATDQGNLELAQKMSDNLFKLRYEDATNKADRWMKAYEIGRENFTKAEQKKADSIKQVYTDRKSMVSDINNYAQSIADDARRVGSGSISTTIMNMSLPDPTATNYEAQMMVYKNNLARLAEQIPVQETEAEIKRNQNVFTETEKSLQQYKDQGYSRQEVESEWKKSNASANQKPEDVELPLTVQRALDNLYGAAPAEEASTDSGAKWYNPLSWF